MSMRDAKAANWVAERATSTGTGFRLTGSSKGYSTFGRAFNAGQEVFYSASDDNGNRECGFATFDGSDLVARQPTATLVNNVYSVSAPQRVDFTGSVNVACTFNASAFNTLWQAIQVLDPDGDGEINIPPELIDGLGEALRNKADQSALDAEVEARKEGDENLQSALEAEVEARKEGDGNLQSALGAEVEARTEGDDNLQQQIDDLGGITGSIKWADIENKPEPIEDLGASESLIKGGRF